MLVSLLLRFQICFIILDNTRRLKNFRWQQRSPCSTCSPCSSWRGRNNPCFGCWHFFGFPSCWVSNSIHFYVNPFRIYHLCMTLKSYLPGTFKMESSPKTTPSPRVTKTFLDARKNSQFLLKPCSNQEKPHRAFLSWWCTFVIICNNCNCVTLLKW